MGKTAFRSVTTSIVWILAIGFLATIQLNATGQERIPAVMRLPRTGSESWTQKEVEYQNGAQKMVRNVAQASLWSYLPEKEKRNGTVVIICPGGGFHFLSWDSEGTAVANWLKDRGVMAFVLRYRLVDTGATEEEFQKRVAQLFSRPGAPERTPEQEKNRREIDALAIEDGRQALRAVRQLGLQEFSSGIDISRIGIMGFSAGGVVAMGVVMNHDEVSRPNFAAAIYGGGTHGAPVPADAPPLFILVANDDKGAAVGSAKLYSQWKEADKPAELHIYSKGGHGFGMNKRGLPVDSWIERFGDWLGAQGFLKK